MQIKNNLKENFLLRGINAVQGAYLKTAKICFRRESAAAQALKTTRVLRAPHRFLPQPPAITAGGALG